MHNAIVTYLFLSARLVHVHTYFLCSRVIKLNVSFSNCLTGDNYVLRGGQTYTFTSTLTSPSGSSSCSSFISVAQVTPEISCKAAVNLQASTNCQAKLSQADLVDQILDYSLPGRRMQSRIYCEGLMIIYPASKFEDIKTNTMCAVVLLGCRVFIPV